MSFILLILVKALQLDGPNHPVTCFLSLTFLIQRQYAFYYLYVVAVIDVPEQLAGSFVLMEGNPVQMASVSISLYFLSNLFFVFLLPLHMQYGSTFHRLEGRSISSPIQGASLASSGIATTLPDNSSNDIHLSVSRPVPSDSDQRYSRLQRDGLVSRRDKSITHFQEDSQTLRRNMSSSGTESLGFGKKWNGVESEEDGKLSHSESSEKALSAKVAFGLAYTQTPSEDEDVCPTCLDGN